MFGLEKLLEERDQTNKELEVLLEEAQFKDPPEEEKENAEQDKPKRTLSKEVAEQQTSSNPVVARRMKDLEQRIQIREHRMGQMKRNYERKSRWMDERVDEIERQRYKLFADQDETLGRNEELLIENDWLKERYEECESRMKTYELTVKDLKKQMRQRSEEFATLQRQIAEMQETNAKQEKKLEEYEQFSECGPDTRALVNIDLHRRADRLEEEKKSLLQRLSEFEGRAPMTNKLLQRGFVRELHNKLGLDRRGKVRMAPDRFRPSWRLAGQTDQAGRNDPEILEVEIPFLS